MPLATGIAIVLVALAAGALAVADRSAKGKMGRKGPGIRTAVTQASGEAWKAAQAAVAPLYRFTAVTLLVAAAVAMALGLAGAPGWLVVVLPVVVAGAGAFFFLGVAAVRADKAAAATIQRSPNRTAKRTTAKKAAKRRR